MSEAGGCLVRIREMTAAMTPREQTLARLAAEAPERVTELNIEEYAAACGVSISTVIRFCKKLGFSGYKSFVRGLCSDLAVASSVSTFEDISPDDDAATVMRNICLSNIKAIEDTAAVNKVEELNRAVALLRRAGRIEFYGVGTSGFVAMDAANKFMRTNKVAAAYRDLHSQILSALTLKPEDCAVLISYSGETRELLILARELKRQGVPVITITKYATNSLSELGDVRLYSCSTETMLRSGAMSSRIAQLSVVDVLYAAVCTSDFAKVKPHLEKTRDVINRLRAADAKGPKPVLSGDPE